MGNRDNPRIGSEFQRQVLNWFTNEYNSAFNMEVEIPIGSRLIDISEYKSHRFDIASDDLSTVIECKRYTWTESGNVPSAKMGFVNEAAFYLSLLKSTRYKYIAMLKSYNPKRNETLAEYYYRTNKHLLGDIIIAEYDPDNNDMIFLNAHEVDALRNKRLNLFARHYLDLYENNDTREQDVCNSFYNDCLNLGIQMDCEKSFKNTYLTDSTIEVNVAVLRSIIDNVDDAYILASEIYSKWRYITHWSYGELCLDKENREWFILAFNKLLDITKENE